MKQNKQIKKNKNKIKHTVDTLAIPSATKAIKSAIIKIIPSYVAIPSATMAITSAFPKSIYSICHLAMTSANTQLSGYNIYYSGLPSATNQHTSMAITSATTFGITSANTIMAITSAIKINLQLVVYKVYKTHKHQYT